MKYIIYFLFFILIGVSVKGQTRPSGIPTQFSTGWFRQGWPQADSGTIFARRDTTFLPRFTGTVVMRPQNRKFYYYDSTDLRWYLLSGTPSDSSFFYVDYIPQTTNPAYNEGRLFYDDANKTLSLFDAISGTSLQIGQEQYVRARNSTGSQINDASVVYINGATGQTATVALAKANSFTTSSVIGMATHNIGNNTVGKVTTYGVVNDINTSSFSAGDKLYLSPTTAGAVTNVQPDVPNFSVFIGYCLNAHPNQGKILIDPQKTLVSVFQLTDTSFVARIDGVSDTIRIVRGTSGSGTVTNVALSMPSAFTVSGSPITTSGTFNVSGAGTTLQYIRGNGTLATFDTTAIPNFYIKARSLLSGTSPITYNSTTGAIGINNATASGTKGAATFVNSSFSDNGLGTIDLLNITSAGTCINCDITFDAKGRAVSYASGTPPNFVNAPGAGDTLSFLDTLKRLNAGFGILHTVTNYNITQKVDTSVIATQYDLTLLNPGLPLNSIQFNNAGSFGGDSLQYYPSDNKILTSQDYFQYGRPVTGFFQDSASNYTTGRLWTVYPRHSGGTGADTLQTFFSSVDNTLYDVTKPENPVFTLLQFGATGNTKPYASIRLEQMWYDQTEYHALVTRSRSMPNPNNETRNWSWTISQINGTADLTTRSSDNRWKLSIENSPYYDREYAVLNSSTLNLKAIGNPASIIANVGASQQWGIGMLVDSSSGSGFAALYVTSTIPTLSIGSQGGGTAIDISNPAGTGGNITFNKFTKTNNKEFRVADLSNSVTGLGVTSSALGYIFSVSTDGSGFADTRNTGTFLINRANAQSASTRMLGIYNNYNADDSLFHVRGNGNLWTKGLVNIKTLKTTLTAPATEGTTKMVICDTNGLLSNADLPTSYTFNNGITNTSGTVQLGGSLIQATNITVGNNSLGIVAANSTISTNRITIDNTNALMSGRYEDFSSINNIYVNQDNIQIISTQPIGARRILLDSITGIQIGENISGIYKGIIVKKTTSQLQFNAYGSETFTGAPIKLLAETSTGDIIEVGGRNLQSGTTYTVLSTDVYKIIGLSNSAARTITLPAASAFPSGVTVWFKDEAGTAGTGNITINRAGSDTIDGATSYTISSNYGFIGLYSNGNNAWFVR